ncbi:carbohydrate porin [Allochromatium palmeri]|uniref:Carbohydrate porin n=1 Tax=Allochromatium palmeri TaxID=231048 RepID=A0A6N8ED28_9GAMM|nr:carbohydrate porin [Allochromatium palmeri]MTW22115.1 carbohydrate porin [Allochromatium palmeri]
MNHRITSRLIQHEFNRIRPRLPATALILTLTAPAVLASDYPSSDYFLADWEARDAWKGHGVSVGLSYTSEPMFNVAGGEKLGGTYTDNIGLEFGFDLQRLLGIPATNLVIKGSKRDGTSVSERFIAPSEGGNLFTVQEIYGGQNVKLANVQFNTILLDERLNIAYGRLIANDDFLRSPLYCQFINNSFCGSPKPVFLQNPFTFTAYPLATWGTRIRYDTPSRVWTLQAAVYDGDPEGKEGDPASSSHNTHGTSWGWGNNGVTMAGEIHYHVNRDSDSALPGTYKVGGYYMTGTFQNLESTDNATATGSAMGWVLGDQMLYRERPGSERGLWGFGALVFSFTNDTNPMPWYFNTGLVYQGLFESRPRDTTGLAITSGWFGNEVNVARRAQGLAEKDYEAVIELNHQFVLGRGISVQPDIQYIIRPAGTGDIDNALAIGARVVVNF